MDTRAIQTEALVLRRFDSGEADRVVWLLTPGRGRIAAFAAAARKSQRRFAGAIEPFTRLDAELSPPGRGDLWRLLDAQVIDSHPALRSSLEALASASAAAELIAELAVEQRVANRAGGSEAGLPRGGHYPLLLAYLRTLASRPFDAGDLGRLVYLALAQAGMRPSFGNCVRCGNAEGGLAGAVESFDPAEGGRLCARCPPRTATAHRTSAVLLAALARSCGQRGDGGGEIDGHGRALLWRYAQHQLDKPVKSLSLLAELGL